MLVVLFKLVTRPAPIPIDATPLTLSDLDGTEMVVLFVGASDCPASLSPLLPDIMDNLRDSLTAKAESLGSRVAFLGAALDHDLDAGLEYLETLGPFDEVTVGRRWLNSLSVQYLIRDMPAGAKIPQVQVFYREIHVDGPWMEIGEDVVLARKIGVDEIMHWGSQGFALLDPPRELPAKGGG